MGKIELSEQQMKWLEEYSYNNMKKLKKVVDKLLIKIGGVEDYERDDYYSIANYQLLKAAISYDSSKCDNFDNYFKVILKRKFASHLRDIHRDKRCRKIIEIDEQGEEVIVFEKDSRLDAKIKDDSENTYSNMIASDKTTENEIFDKMQDSKSEKFINSLTANERIILDYLLKGYKKNSDISQASSIPVEKVKRYRDSISYRMSLI